MRVLLDTNAYSALMRGEGLVAARTREAEAVVMSAIVVGELLYGFRHGSRYTENRHQLDEFLRSPHVSFLPVTRETAERFAVLAAELRRQGTPIPSNDIWIAAHALESQATLVSFDCHFEHIGGLLFVRPNKQTPVD